MSDNQNEKSCAAKAATNALEPIGPGSLLAWIFEVIQATEIVPAPPRPIFDRREELRESIWLWLQLFMRTESRIELVAGEKWWVVEGVFADKDLAVIVKTSVSTARLWRRRLEKAGVIRSFHVNGRERRFEIWNMIADAAPPRESLSGQNFVN